jgi:3-hydroxyacyl-[acyl-carrier-protein] dehydratase
MDQTIPGTSVNIMDIQTMLPHRYPFLLVDRVEEMHEAETAVGIKNVTASEPWFTGHFPERPIFPGVLIIEAMAQTAAVLVITHLRETEPSFTPKSVYFMSIDKARFRAPCIPGDQIRIHVEKINQRRGAYKFGCIAKVNDKVVAQAEVMAMNVMSDE